MLQIQRGDLAALALNNQGQTIGMYETMQVLRQVRTQQLRDALAYATHVVFDYELDFFVAKMTSANATATDAAAAAAMTDLAEASATKLGKDEYKCELRGKKRVGRTTAYFVHWSDYEEDQNTWYVKRTIHARESAYCRQPTSDISDRSLIQDYDATKSWRWEFKGTKANEWTEFDPALTKLVEADYQRWYVKRYLHETWSLVGCRCPLRTGNAIA